jgi:hypothetical protein
MAGTTAGLVPVDGRAGKNFDRFIFAFFNSIDP